MKRKVGPTDPGTSKSQAVSAQQGSRFVTCPACQRSVPLAFINMHLDTSCLGLEAAAAPTTPNRIAIAQQGQDQAVVGYRSSGRPCGLPPFLSAGALPQQASTAQLELQHDAISHVTKCPTNAPAQEGSEGTAQHRCGGLGSNESRRTDLPAWQLGPAEAVAFQSSGKAKGLTAEALFAVSQCELVSNFLPPQLANDVLRQLMADQPKWERLRWWFPKGESTGSSRRKQASTQEAVQSNRTSCYYLLQQDAQAAEVAKFSNDDELGQQRQLPDDVQTGSSLYDRKPAFPALQLAADKVAGAVSSRIQRGGAAGLPLEAADRESWAPTYAFANCYADGSEGLASHSDRLTQLGPTPIIASLSLGATRCFRLHRTQHVALSSGGINTGASSSAAHSSTFGTGSLANVVRLDLDLPHNSLLIMWPPTQECWKHEVPKTAKQFDRHRISGSARFNLTLRRLKPQWQQQAPLCRCGRPSVMKTRIPKQQHLATHTSYYYCCDNSKGPTCGFYAESPHQVRL